MWYSTINQRLTILDGRIRCFDTAEEALEHARETGDTVYCMGFPIELQLEFDFERRQDEIQNR